MNKNNNDRLPYRYLMYLFVGGGVGITLVINIIVSSVRDAVHLGPFKDHVSEYSTVSGLKNPAMTNPYVMKPYLKRKIITIDKKENRIDAIYYELPEELDFRLIGKERGASAWHRVPSSGR